MTILEMKESLLNAGVYSKEDVDAICQFEAEYASECAVILTQCEEEGVSQQWKQL